MKFRARFSWLLLSVLVLGGSLRGAESGWHTLLNDSPFGATAPVADASVAVQPEFRGYVVEGRELYFNLYDPIRKRSFWLQQEEKSETLTPRRFDPDRKTLTITYNGREMALAMKQAKVVLNAQPAPAPSVASGGVSAPETKTADAPEESAKVEQNTVRALRRQAYALREKQGIEIQRQVQAARAAREAGENQ